MVIFRPPNINDEKILCDYMNEHYLNHEKNITASMGFSNHAFLDWIGIVENNEFVGNEFGKSLLYLCFDNNKLIGILSIRYGISEELAKKYGHIGYGVRPSERHKGYGMLMLKYALSVCKNKGLKEVILGCYEDNIPSRKIIEKSAGKLFAKKEFCDNEKIALYYKIFLQ